MIQLIEAPPRSGKSYYAVNYLMDFVKYDGLYREFKLNANVLIISNIEGLKINHWRLDECLKKQPLTEFFKIANFEEIMKQHNKNHVIILIDEAHELFPAGMKNPEIYNFFAYHGHIGLDVFFMTQGFESMSRMFNPLVEFVVKVTPRSKSILKTFSYGFYDKGGKFLYSKSLAKKQLVFDAYTSFRQDEKNKPKNALLHWMIIFAVLMVCAGGLFKTALAIVANKAKPQNAHKQVSASAAEYAAAHPVLPVSSVPSAVPVAAPVAVMPVQPVLSSASLPHFVPVPVSGVSSVIPDNIPRVIGLVGDADGRNRKYLLSTGQVTTCKRSLNIGDIYIR
ncbi:MAG: zonular occludens toxin domain-containing protein [Desulfuromonadaceae bacterium]|nr:zonular occludens toxin domain-containing protein [Desulfuromonadaceae bacterium]